MSAAVVNLFDNVTQALLGQLLLQENFGQVPVTGTHYFGTVRAEVNILPATPPLVAVQKDPPQRSDIQGIGTHMFNLANNVERQAEALSTLATKTVQVIQADHEYLRSELEYVRNRCRLLEAKLHLAGVYSPSPPFDEDDSF